MSKYIQRKVEIDILSRDEEFRLEIQKKLQKPENLNEWAKISTKESEAITQEIYKKFGVFSMSRVNNDILMWSHYAEKHKGFCIEFERSPDNLLGDINRTRPVEYSKDYPEIIAINSDGNINPDLTQLLTYRKAEGWAYEKEWRIVYGEGGVLEPLPGDISAIIFGQRMTDDNANTIKNILGYGSNIQYNKIVKPDYKFELKIAPNW